MNERIVRALMVKFSFVRFRGWGFHKTFIGLAAVIAAMLLFHSGVAHAGVVYSWTKTMGGTGHDVGRSVVVDSGGNVYMTGFFSDTVDFDPDGAGDIHIGGEDLFLTRINSDGSYGWTKTSTGGAHGCSVVEDGSGNIYVTGEFGGTTDFDPGGAGDSHTSAGLSEDIFLTKISSAGTYGWTKTIGGTAMDVGISVASDNSGNLFMAGYFSGTVDFDPDGAGDSHISAGTTDVFLTRINSDGTYGWTKTMGGTGDEDTQVTVAVDGSGNVYVAGYFTGTADFNPGGGGDSHTSAGLGDIFLTKISSTGTYGWTKTMGGTGEDGGLDLGSVAVDGSGNVYVAGYFTVTADFDPGAGTDYHTSSGSGDVSLTRINSDGTYGWTKIIGGTGDDMGGAWLDNSGNIYLSGVFSDTVNFAADWADTDSHTSAGDWDIFLTKINPDGTYGWTKTMGGTAMDASRSVAADSSGNVYIIGQFYGTADFDPGTGVDNHTSAGVEDDIFLTKFMAEAGGGGGGGGCFIATAAR